MLNAQFTAENVVGTKQDFSVRTGTLQFKADWPGIFIRGDDALNYAATIRALLKDPAASGRCGCLEELAELLESCRVSR
jgi:hypothetical protein